ncbi:MAG: SGNH/GDSL hydrolase family protein [Bacteroidetes bacterium]|nr:SGNH/GDSL hydrolase family protein [Bacteroidota bacterium]
MAKTALSPRLIGWLLVLSLAINGIIVGGIFYFKYIRYPAYYRDTVKLAGFKTPSGASTLFAGDSFAALYKWPVLSKHTNLAIYGLGGSTTTDWKKWVTELTALPADTVILWLGTNDLLQGHSPDSTADRLAGLTNELIGMKKTVVLLKVLGPNGSYTLPDQSTPDEFSRLNHLMDSHLFSSCIRIDLSAWLADSSGILPMYSHDGLHLNPVGYRIADVLITLALYGKEKP